MNHDTRWALITGLVRDEGQLRNKVKTLNQWRSEGIISGIVFSTWFNEVDSYPGLASFLFDEDVELIESQMPELNTSGHMLHQMKSLAIGLEACPDDAWVLRLRSDMVTLSDTVKLGIMHTDDLHSSPLEGWPSLFESRILIHGGLLYHPLFFNDIIYMGKRNDLIKLCSGSLAHELFGLTMNPEQVFYSGPFLTMLPLFGHYFRVNPGLFHSNFEQSKFFATTSIKNSFYQKIFALNVLVLSQYFRVGLHDRKQYTPTSLINHISKDTTFDSFIDLENTSRKVFMEFFEPSKTIHFYSDYWIEALLNDCWSPSELSITLKENIQSLTNISAQDQYRLFRLNIDTEAQRYAGEIQILTDCVQFRGYSTPTRNLNRVHVPGRPMNVRLG